jgi:hypothetical protein
MPNHWQTVDLDFEAQLRNQRFSSPRARWIPYTASPNLPIIRSLSIWPLRPSPILYTRSPTPATIIVVCHVTPATCTLRDKQTRFSEWNNDKGKTIKMFWIRIQISRSQWLITIKPKNWSLGFSVESLVLKKKRECEMKKVEGNTHKRL